MIFVYDKIRPLNTGDWLIEVTTWVGLTVFFLTTRDLYNDIRS